MKKVCVFCGSSFGTNPLYASAAAELGRSIAQRGFELIYGAGDVGLMGVVADAALEADGKVTGVITSKLVDKEVAHPRLTALEIVETMHERKQRLSELADAFVVLPGGFGTLDETFDVLTRAQLAYHSKPCGLLNVNGFFDGLLSFLTTTVEEKFLKQVHLDLLITDTDGEQLLTRLENHQPTNIEKWILPE
jgi:uncharacterized protein (TIGR00730 family)